MTDECLTLDDLRYLAAPETTSPEYLAKCNERRELLAACLRSLGRRHQLLIELRYGDEEMGFTGIGRQLGIGKSAAKRLHDRILTKLRESLHNLRIRELREML